MTRWTAALHPERFNQPHVKKIILLLAILLFAGGIWVSFRQQPDILHGFDLGPFLILVTLGVPLTVCINAGLFVLTAWLVGKRTTFVNALEIGIIGSAANMLPLPGGAVVRVLGLKTLGAGYGKGTGATLLVGLLWAGAAFVYAGAWILTLGGGILGSFFIAGGFLLTLATMVASARLAGSWGPPVLLLVLTLCLVVLDALRIFWCFGAIGNAAGFAQASAFSIAGVVGSAVSIVPAGLGIREAVSAGIAPIVGLAPSMGFLAASLNRLAGLLVLLPLAIALAIRLRTRREASG